MTNIVVQEDAMKIHNVSLKPLLLGMSALLAACSGPSEDVRVSFCKNITKAAVPSAQSIEWKSNDNTFRRPEYAIAALTFDATDRDGKTTSMRSECFFEYDAIEDTAQHLADPFSAYSTLPFAMTLDGRALSDGELVRLRNGEQVRLGKAAIQALETNAKALADKVRAGIGQ